MKTGLDAIDEKILELMQGNARISIKEIASQVFLSSPAVAARIARLEDRDYISGYHAQLNLEALGYRIKAFVSLDLEQAHKDAFTKYVQACDNVVECNSITGDYNILMEVAFPGTSELDEFVNGLQGYGRTHTQIVFSTSVEHRGIPLHC